MWQALTSDKSILQTIPGFKIPFTKSAVQIFTPKLSSFNVEQMKGTDVNLEQRNYMPTRGYASLHMYTTFHCTDPVIPFGLLVSKV